MSADPREADEKKNVLVIRASEWLRGEGEEASRLYRVGDGRCCCLGLDALRCGFSRETIAPWQGPSMSMKPWGDASYVDRWVFEDGRGAGYYHNDADRAMEINDAQYTTDEQKIEALRPIFAAVGIEIEWRPNE